jgi:hypothetical protein
MRTHMVAAELRETQAATIMAGTGFRVPAGDHLAPACRRAEHRPAARGFIDGHGWFNLHEPRLGPPDGYDTHWSRLIDAGLAGMLWLFGQFTDAALAERLMRTMWPMLWLVPTMAGATAIAWRIARARCGADHPGARRGRAAGLPAFHSRADRSSQRADRAGGAAGGRGGLERPQALGGCRGGRPDRPRHGDRLRGAALYRARRRCHGAAFHLRARSRPRACALWRLGLGQRRGGIPGQRRPRPLGAGRLRCDRPSIPPWH